MQRVERVLVTGVTGYVAGWCIVDLLEAGHEVVTTIPSPERETEVRAAVGDDPERRLRFAVAGLTADAGWDAAMAGCVHVLHVASPLSGEGDDAALIVAAREGTLRVLAAAERAGVQRVVVTSSCAAGERFIVSGPVLWFGQMAEILRRKLGADAARVPTDALSDDDFRSVAQLSPQLASLLPLLGRDLQHSPAKAKRVLGWQPRPAVETVVDSARCLLGAGA